MRCFRRARSADSRGRPAQNRQRAKGEGAARPADKRADVERLDTGLDPADLRHAAVINHELYGFYGVSVWVTSAAYPRELLESTKLIKFERYAEFTVADLTGRGLAL